MDLEKVHDEAEKNSYVALISGLRKAETCKESA